MTKYSLKTSTAILLALSVFGGSPVKAQDDLPEGAICADGAVPPCAEGVELILSGAICADGEMPPCAEGIELILPDPEELEAAGEGVVETLVPEGVEAPSATEEAAEAPTESAAPAEESAAETEVVEDAAPEVEPSEATAMPVEESAPVEGSEPAEEELPVTEEASASPEEAVVPENEPMPEQATAEDTAPEAVLEKAASEDEPAQESAPPTDESTVAETTDMAQPATEEAEAPEQMSSEDDQMDTAEIPVAKVPAEESPEQDAQPEEATSAVVEDAENGTEEASAETAEEVQAEPVEETVLIAPGAEEMAEEAEQVMSVLGDVANAAEGETDMGAIAAAIEDGAMEAAETVEMAITEEESRQSTEDFTTSIAGNAPAAAGAKRSETDLEKAALIGLGVLAAGAILSNGDEVVANSGDRVVMRRGEEDYYVLKDDDALLRQPGATVRTERFNDGSTRTTVTREDEIKIITIRNASGRVLRRVREDARGRQVVLIDDIATYDPVEIETLPEPVSREVSLEGMDPIALSIALERATAAPKGRGFSLRQIREIEQVRKLVPEIALDDVTFAMGSAAIDTSQARNLIRVGDLIKVLIEDNPGEVFLIEGHTDATGSAYFNLALSDRRAESFALALTEYFEVPPENLVVQGYGESDLKIDTEADEVRNRRVTVRRITPLLGHRLARQ